tara:strand:- start:1390 stop:1719 length:330 start_codon:yes stop_codon:yes gene_type:complete
MAITTFNPFPTNKPLGVQPESNFEGALKAVRRIAVPALASELLVDISNIGSILTFTPTRVEAELLGPDEISINSKEVGVGGLSKEGDITYHFRGVPAGATHTLELTFHR